MKKLPILTFALVLGLHGFASADMSVVDKLALGPEGPIYDQGKDGNLLHVFTFSGDGVTNVTFSDSEEELFVTYVIDLMDPWSGKVVKIDNVR